MPSKPSNLFPPSLALAAAVSLALATRAAPVPLPTSKKPLQAAPPASVVGTWIMGWGDNEDEGVFHAGGSYHHRYRGSVYVGTWHLRGGTLEVCEGVDPRDGTAPVMDQTWQATLERTSDGWRGLAGGSYGAIAFHLRK